VSQIMRNRVFAIVFLILIFLSCATPPSRPLPPLKIEPKEQSKQDLDTLLKNVFDMSAPNFSKWMRKKYPDLFAKYEDNFNHIVDVYFITLFMKMLDEGMDFKQILLILWEEDRESFERNEGIYKMLYEKQLKKAVYVAYLDL
tara:strand:+ start:504 stop:932 length:429 start_codon:yes stop_codon:yes gene_type:complete